MPIGQPTAVVDTDILFSPKRRTVIVEAVAQKRLLAVWSPNIIAELFRILTISWIEKHGGSRPSLDSLSAKSKALMELLLGTMILVDTGPRDDRNYPGLRDLDDLHLIAAGKLSTADLVVSDNVRDFPAPDEDGGHFYDDLEFVTYETLLARLAVDERSFSTTADLV